LRLVKINFWLNFQASVVSSLDSDKTAAKYRANSNYILLHVCHVNLFIFYKHMKFRKKIRLCLAIYDFEVRIMLSLCLTFQGTRPVMLSLRLVLVLRPFFEVLVLAKAVLVLTLDGLKDLKKLRS